MAPNLGAPALPATRELRAWHGLHLSASHRRSSAHHFPFLVGTTLSHTHRAAVFAVFWALSIGALPAARAQASAQAPAAPPVIVGLSTELPDHLTLSVMGNGVARRSVTLFAAVAGEVAERRFRTGERVAAGRPLLRLVDRSQRLAVDLAAARVDAAQALARRYEGTRGTGAVPESLVDEARSALRTAQIELAQAREVLAEHEVRAPFAGVVGLASVAVGDRVSTDTALVTLDDRTSLRVEVELPEAHLARLTPRQAVSASTPAYPGRRFAGEIAEVDSRVDPVTRNVRVRAIVPNTDDVLRPGMSFQVQLQLLGPARVSVPELALQWGREGAFVWAVRAGHSVQVPVRPVRRSDGRVLIDSALKAGEAVVVEGVQRLRADRPVRVLGPSNGS